MGSGQGTPREGKQALGKEGKEKEDATRADPMKGR